MAQCTMRFPVVLINGYPGLGKTSIILSMLSQTAGPFFHVEPRHWLGPIWKHIQEQEDDPLDSNEHFTIRCQQFLADYFNREELQDKIIVFEGGQ